MFWRHFKKSARKPRKYHSRVVATCRRGIATIETAVTLPLLALLTFGSIELSNLMYVRQSLTVAAYEGARCVTRPGGSQTLAVTRIQEVLNARGITSYTALFTPTVTTATARGTMIQVSVSATNASVSYAPFRLFSGNSLSSSTTMVRQ